MYQQIFQLLGKPFRNKPFLGHKIPYCLKFGTVNIIEKQSDLVPLSDARKEEMS